MASTGGIDNALSSIQHALEGIIEDASSLLSRVEGLDAEEADTWLADKVRDLGSALRSRGRELESDADELATEVDGYAEAVAAEEEGVCSGCNRPFWAGGGEHDDTGQCEECVAEDLG